MRVVILASSLDGTAAACLPQLTASNHVEIAMIVYNEGRLARTWQYRKRKLAKIRRIGLLGALNGVRMRAWFKPAEKERPERLDTLAARYGLRFETTPTINSPRTVELFTAARAELGLSLGNGYIGKKVYSVPRYGMLNIHGELLPEFQGAQSVIWQIHEGADVTGYTIHRIARRIDTGDILYRETLPIVFKPTLKETVIYNRARIAEASRQGLLYVLENYSALAAKGMPQTAGRSFTTPDVWQFLKIMRQHKKLYRQQQANK